MIVNKITYIRLDILVLKVESVLPDINTDNGEVRNQGVLVGSGSNLEFLSRRVNAL